MNTKAIIIIVVTIIVVKLIAVHMYLKTKIEQSEVAEKNKQDEKNPKD